MAAGRHGCCARNAFCCAWGQDRVVVPMLEHRACSRELNTLCRLSHALSTQNRALAESIITQLESSCKRFTPDDLKVYSLSALGCVSVCAVAVAGLCSLFGTALRVR